MIGPLFAFLSSGTWAVGSAKYSVLAKKYDPFSVNFARASVALPLFLVVAAVGGVSDFSKLSWGSLGWFAVSMFSSYGFGDVVFLLSTQSLGVPAALAIASLYPIWTALAGWGFRGEVLGLTQIAGLALAVLGVVIVILKSSERKANVHDAQKKNMNILVGVALAVATSFFWAMNTYSVAQGGRDLPVGVSNSVRMFFALIFSFSLGHLLLRKKIGLPREEYRKSTWLFVFESFAGSYFYMVGVTHSSLAVGATLTSLAPILSVPVAAAMGLERMTWLRTLGIGLVILGISLLMGVFNVNG